VNPEVRVEGLEKVLTTLKEVEPDAIKTMRSEIRTIISATGVISSIKSRAPQIAPMSGMNHSGPTRWAGVRSVTTSVLPRTAALQKKSVPLVRIAASGGKEALGFDYAELAGIRRRPPRARSKIRGSGLRGTQKGDGSIALRGQGDNFIKVLEDRNGQRPGRFAYRAVQSARYLIEQGMQKVLDSYAQRVNRKLR
jgi:hypothetical protein